MKRKFMALITGICVIALTLCGTVAFATTPSIVHDNDYSKAFEKSASEGDVKNLTIKKLETDVTEAYATTPAGSLELTCDKTLEGKTNIFSTKSKVINMKKPVIIKWRENFGGNMSAYYIGISSDPAMKGDPVTAEFCFGQNWGSATTAGQGSMKTSFSSKSASVGAWDLGLSQVARGIYNFYQIKIEYNTTTSKYDVTLSSEVHNGTSPITLATYSVDIPTSTFDGGAYLFMHGYSGATTASSIYLLNDTRTGYLAGTNFTDWYHTAKVNDEAGLDLALADTSITAIDCVISDTFHYIDNAKTISRSVVLTSVNANGDRQDGMTGIIFEKGLTITGAKTVFEMAGGCATVVVDGAKATLSVTSLGYNKTGLDADKPDHCVEVKNGGTAIANWSALDVSGKGAVKLSGDSTFEAKGNADTVYSLASLVSVEINYKDIIPSIFCDSKGVARIYAVLEGENNKVLGFDGLDNPLVRYDSASNGSFMIQYSPISDFTFDKTAIEVAIGGSTNGQLTATVPEEPTNLTAFSYTVENTEIADVVAINQGLGFKITGKKAGTTNLIIKTTDRLNPADVITKTIPITVTAPTIVGFEVDSSKVVKDLEFGSALDLSKLVVSAKLSDDSTNVLTTSDYTVDKGGFDANVAGTYTIKIKYGEFTAQSFVVTVKEKAVIKEEPTGCAGCNGEKSATAQASIAVMLLLVGATLVIKKH